MSGSGPRRRVVGRHAGADGVIIDRLECGHEKRTVKGLRTSEYRLCHRCNYGEVERATVGEFLSWLIDEVAAGR